MKTDVAIVGAGLAGLALARALRGLQVALIAPERVAPPPQGWDARVYAITPGNAAFLSGLRVWQALPAERVAPVRAMRVFGDDGAAVLDFDAYRAGASALAWIVEDGRLREALWGALAGRDELQILAPARCARLEIGAQCALLGLEDGRAIEARLVVGADGARSRVREQAGIAAADTPYAQSAVVANFACARPHGGTAFQWFQGGPVLALLPLPGERVSMVWSVDEAQAARLLSLAPAALCSEVALASGRALGELDLVTAPRAFPLRRLAARRTVAPRVALAGDAAHVIHPLAGQGANLGLQDARELAAVLALREPQRDPGELGLLRRYERARARDVLLMDAMVHGLFRLFGAAAGPAARLRNSALNLADRLPVLKNHLIRQAIT